jgi:hypothetical protein
LFCVLGVVLKTSIDVYNLFYLNSISLDRNDSTPRKIDR